MAEPVVPPEPKPMLRCENCGRAVMLLTPVQEAMVAANAERYRIPKCGFCPENLHP